LHRPAHDPCPPRRSSDLFSVTATAITLTAAPSSVAAGSDVTATWTGIATPTAKDWVGVWMVGQPDSDVTRIAVKYTGGTASGNKMGRAHVSTPVTVKDRI